MSTAQFSKLSKSVFPSNATQPAAEVFDELLGQVVQVIAPVWPLADYVAVNPYAGMSQLSFRTAHDFLQEFSKCEMMMPLEHYAAEFRLGRFVAADIESAIAELGTSLGSVGWSVSQIVDSLNCMGARDSSANLRGEPSKSACGLCTVAEFAKGHLGVDWQEAIIEEVSKHCAAHYDQGQATWASSYKDLPLYQAWRSAAERDCNIEILGLNRFRKFVSSLPHTPEAAIVQLLHQLEVPVQLWKSFLLCQAFSIPGWSAWAKYQANWTNDQGLENNDLVGLLALRLAYDAGLAQAKNLRVDWAAMVGDRAVESLGGEVVQSEATLRYILLRASELGYRDSLLRSLSISSVGTPRPSSERKLAQMVFCIDVRSERMRRQLELRSSDIETYGFAGFFGMAFNYAELGQPQVKSQLPVLLKPQFTVHEGVNAQSQPSDRPQEASIGSTRRWARAWRSLWRGFQTSAIGGFSFVETLGLGYGLKLLLRAVGVQPLSVDKQWDGLPPQLQQQLGPTLRGLNHQGITTSSQVDLAENMLRNLGLTHSFAHLVAFCGHTCQTENNPLAAGLECGACGGHSGKPNARFAAMLLNQSYIRQALALRGIKIPADTHFLAAVHNTTTDAVEFFDIGAVPAAVRPALQELLSSCSAATQQTQIERLPSVASRSTAELLKRARDWSEVRPEWGLAGNAAFIAAPRQVTQQANLDARSFLHSYDFTQDAEGKVLETIMTAPMIVAHWINMQYYASTVDNQHFGSGNKTIHNVVGRFGILSGNGGDLKSGLPWQSLHTGEAYQHLPVRLQVVIAAPRTMLERVISKHEMVANLLDGDWLHLIAIEAGHLYRYAGHGTWDRLIISCTNNQS
jgi:uncharacterized protein YbcC (UPF0753/DUF2309 family)